MGIRFVVPLEPRDADGVVVESLFAKLASTVAVALLVIAQAPIFAGTSHRGLNIDRPEGTRSHR